MWIVLLNLKSLLQFHIAVIYANIKNVNHVMQQTITKTKDCTKNMQNNWHKHRIELIIGIHMQI
jgi:fructose-1-phosphate kinase PfkB-like protein